MWNSIDACIVYEDKGKAYFFSGTEYVRYDIKADKADAGYPKPIAGNWPGLHGPVSAAVKWPNGKIYFFFGDQYMRYDVKADKVDAAVKPIKGNWPGLAETGLHDIGAAAAWPNGKGYFFGDWARHEPGEAHPPFRTPSYVRYDIKTDKADGGYPKYITEGWPGVVHGLEMSYIDAIGMWPNGKAYFFSGTHYVRYDVKKDKADPGYPKPIAGNWPGVPVAAPAPPAPPK
jgi:hypothetical protein